MTVTQEEFIHLQNLYDAEIAYLDHTLGQLFKLLQHRNILDDMVIVLLADHGETSGTMDSCIINFVSMTLSLGSR